jgi:hypothetical protein
VINVPAEVLRTNANIYSCQINNTKLSIEEERGRITKMVPLKVADMIEGFKNYWYSNANASSYMIRSSFYVVEIINESSAAFDAFCNIIVVRVVILLNAIS